MEIIRKELDIMKKKKNGQLWRVNVVTEWNNGHITMVTDNTLNIEKKIHESATERGRNKGQEGRSCGECKEKREKMGKLFSIEYCQWM